MKAIVNSAPGQLQMQTLPAPTPGAGQVRIRTEVCGICATDLEMIDGWQRTGFPSIPGHEWCGRVDAVGVGVDAGLIGKRCVGDNVLADGGEVGFEHPGAYGEYFLTEAATLHPLPADFSPLVGVLIEPLAVVVRGFKHLQSGEQRRALILGDGPIGLLMLMVFRNAGFQEVVMIGGRQGRLALAEKLGAVDAVNYSEFEGDAGGLAQRLGQSFPLIVEASGSAQSIQNALRFAARGGKILLLGDYRESQAEFRWNQLIHQELTLLGSNASADAWAEAVGLAVTGGLPLEVLVSRRFPASAFVDAFSLVRSQQSDVVKVVLEWT